MSAEVSPTLTLLLTSLHAASFAPMESSTSSDNAAAASTSAEAAPSAWASSAGWGGSATKSEEATPAAGWGAPDAKSDQPSGTLSGQALKPWGKPAAEVKKDEESTAAGYDSGYGASPETSPAKSTSWGRSLSASPPAKEEHSPIELDESKSRTLETVDEEERPEDFLAKMRATGDADSDGGSGTITPTEAARLEADLNKVSLDDDA